PQLMRAGISIRWQKVSDMVSAARASAAKRSARSGMAGSPAASHARTPTTRRRSAPGLASEPALRLALDDPLDHVEMRLGLVQAGDVVEVLAACVQIRLADLAIYFLQRLD